MCSMLFALVHAINAIECAEASECEYMRARLVYPLVFSNKVYCERAPGVRDELGCWEWADESWRSMMHQ